MDDFVLPGLVIQDVGRVGLPLSEHHAKEIISKHSQNDNVILFLQSFTFLFIYL